MIEKIHYRNLTNNELYTLIKAILSILAGVDQETLNLKIWLVKLQAPFEKLELSIGLDKGSAKTQLIDAADDLRDNCFRAFKIYVEACRIRNNHDWQTAAELLWRILISHGLQMHVEGYAKQSSLLDNLILELDESTDAKAAVNTILAQEWFAEMKSSQDRFKALWNERREEMMQKPTSQSREARKEIKDSSLHLFQFIELNYISSGQKVYLDLMNEINEEIKKSNAIVKARKTRRENDKEELVKDQ